MGKTERHNSADELALERFLPYRLSIVAQTVSRALSKQYGKRFGLNVPQWRVMAVLGRFAPLSASQVCERTVMDKVAVSRAVTALLQRGLIERTTDSTDRRRLALRLSKPGGALHRQIVPLALDYERQLLAGLSAQERATLSAVFDKLLRSA
ncbi:MAG: MarR family transcriptional regulator [Rhodospirillales bacterium]